MTARYVWMLGITSGARTDVSPLETRLKSRSVAWTRSWTFLSDTGENMFGTGVSHACGTAPPVYDLGPVSKEFAAAATDAELREFVRVMQTETKAQQQSAVDAAIDTTFQALAAAKPGE